jgi:hypothetical protein
MQVRSDSGTPSKTPTKTPSTTTQSGAETKKKSGPSAWAVTADMYARGGGACFFQGMRAKLMQTVSTAAFMFLFYERLRAANRKLIARLV